MISIVSSSMSILSKLAVPVQTSMILLISDVSISHLSAIIFSPFRKMGRLYAVFSLSFPYLFNDLAQFLPILLLDALKHLLHVVYGNHQ